MSPHLFYYRLHRRDQRPGAGSTADGQFVLEGHSVIAVEDDPELLTEARINREIPDLSGQGLRKLTPSDHPDAEREVALKLQELEEAGKIEIVHKQGSLE
jgi:hypothetical protein